MKMTMTIQSGAFAVPARALEADAGHRDRGTAGPGASVLGSTLIPTAARTASAWSAVGVPTPVPVRHGGALG